MQATLAFLVVVGGLVLAHEYGHYLLARLHGVRVTTFSIGFGPKLLSWRHGPTLFCLSAIPVGGYVRLAGARLSDEATGAPDEFRSKSRWARVQIYLAGPLMNLGVAVVLGAVAYAWAGPAPASDEDGVGVVEWVLPGSPADFAGFKPGDRMLGAGMSCDCTLADVRSDFDASASVVVDVEIQRAGQTLLVATPHPQGHVGTFDALGLALRVEPMPTAYADPDGQPAGSRPSAKSTVLVSPIESRAVVTPPAPARGAIGAVGVAARGMLGAVSILPGEVRSAIDDRRPERLIVGPIGIARLLGQAAQSGWLALVELATALSLGLALLNLLPIPVTDGGQICLLIVEALCRRDASMGVRGALAVVGFALMIGLGGAATYLDLRALW